MFAGYALITDTLNEETILRAAGALELCHTGLLIQDDVMDQDEKRRGLPSVHTQYAAILKKDGTKNIHRVSESLAYCTGNMALFLGMQSLTTITPETLATKLADLFASELTMVGIAQMQDVYGGQTIKPLSLDDILSVYAYKTGRYSCGLPLVVGAMIAGGDEETMHKLWKLGTALGVIFQIRDDYLNLFGDTKKTGKPIGSDIREGKQTLYHHFLLQKSTGDTKQKIQTCFGNPNLTEDDIAFILEQIHVLDVVSDIQAIVTKHTAMVEEYLRTIPWRKEGKDIVQSFIDIVTKRES